VTLQPEALQARRLNRRTGFEPVLLGRVPLHNFVEENFIPKGQPEGRGLPVPTKNRPPQGANVPEYERGKRCFLPMPEGRGPRAASVMDKSRRCANCGHQVSPSARYCSNCGEKQGDLRPRAGTGLLPANRKLNGDRYLVLRKLAQGGQSAVYLAMDTASGQRCVLKELSESQLTPQERVKAINDFLREANILTSLNHPGLCRVFGTFFEDNQKPFLVMEYVEGHNLEDELVGLGRPLEWQRVASWGLMLADVLGYLHNQNPPIVYRDLKPANVMLLRSGVIKLIDFGIARQLFPARLRDTARLGTDGYAPLEQYSGRSEPRSDLYALGASLYHLLTGRVPDPAPLRYTGRQLMPIRSINPNVPEPLERVIQQAMKLDAKDRFPNAYAMRQALEWACRVNMPGGGGPGWAAASGNAPGSSSTGHGPVVTQPQQSVMPGASAPGGSPDDQSGVSPDGAGGWPGRMNGDRQSLAGQPKLRLWPLRLDVGLLEANQKSVQVLDLSNRGGGQLSGMVETNSPCITVDPTHLDSTTTHLRVQVTTAGLAPGEHRYLLAVRTNGGDQIVPVSFMVRSPDGSAAGDWASRRS
jgi:serine/threonine protein kinase